MQPAGNYPGFRAAANGRAGYLHRADEHWQDDGEEEDREHHLPGPSLHRNGRKEGSHHGKPQGGQQDGSKQGKGKGRKIEKHGKHGQQGRLDYQHEKKADRHLAQEYGVTAYWGQQEAFQPSLLPLAHKGPAHGQGPGKGEGNPQDARSQFSHPLGADLQRKVEHHHHQEAEHQR